MACIQFSEILVDSVTKHLNGKLPVASVVPLVERVPLLETVQTEQESQQSQCHCVGKHKQQHDEDEEVESPTEVSPAIYASDLLEGSHDPIDDAVYLLDGRLHLREFLIEALPFLLNTIFVIPFLQQKESFLAFRLIEQIIFCVVLHLNSFEVSGPLQILELTLTQNQRLLEMRVQMLPACKKLIGKFVDDGMHPLVVVQDG